MAKLKKLINAYGEVIDFNHKVEEFFIDNEIFLRKNSQEKYSKKTLMETLSCKMTVNIGLKIKGRLTLVENENSSEGKKTEMIFNGAEIHCLAKEIPDLMRFGFFMHLIVGNEINCLIFPIAKNKTNYPSEIKTVSFNRKKKTISEKNQTVIFFSSRKDFNQIVTLCQTALQSFNDHLPKDSKLIPNSNL